MDINWAKEEYDLVEKPAIDLLVNELGYSYINGKDLNRKNEREVILSHVLFDAMKRINPDCTDDEINKATKVTHLVA